MYAQNTFIINMLSLPRYVKVVRHAGEQMALAGRLNECQSTHIALALDEALANVIKHGYQCQHDCPIHVHITRQTHEGQKCLKMVIEDECENVQLDQIKSRDLEDVRPGGLGVHIIQQIMDDVHYKHRTNCQGVQLTMIKYLP